MEKGASDNVVLFMDQHDSKNHSLETDHQKPISGEEKTAQHPSRMQTLRRLSFAKPKARFVEYNLPINYKISSELDPLTSNENDSSTDDDSEDDDDGFEEEGGGMGREKYRKKKRKINYRALWPPGLQLGYALCCLPHREKLHASRKSIVLRLWPSKELPELSVVRACSYCVDNHLQSSCPQEKQDVEKGISSSGGDSRRRNHLAHQNRPGKGPGLVSFTVATYFDRMMESVFHHYVLDTLSGPPMDEVAFEEAHRRNMKESKSLPARWREGKSFSKSKKFGSRRIDMEKLKKLSQQSTTSAWNVKRLVNYVRSFGLSTISKTVDKFGRAESEITSEWEARNCAKRIFKNVAKPGAKYIEEEDLMRYLKRVEIHTIFPLFEGALETGRITKDAFRNWVVRAYFERKSLAHSLNDTKTAVQQLHKLASAVVSVIIIVVSLIVMGLATTQVISLVITQLVLLGFMFGNTCKTIFESIIFVFVMHPFDIGDRCVIDGVQMVVEEMNILTTVFLRYDMEKIYYPNSVLLTKPISNFYRSPEMIDPIDFTIDVSTPSETIVALKKAIQAYIESKPKYWNPKHSVIVKAIENVDKLKMCVSVQHTINHQNYGERNNRVTDLILELKKIFENLVSLATLAVILLALFSPVAHRKPAKNHPRPWLALSLYIHKPQVPNSNLHPTVPLGAGALMFHRTLTEGPENTSRVVGKAQGFIIPIQHFAHSAFNIIYLTFDTHEYSGSISVQAETVAKKDREELTVVGGTGSFAFARGLAVFAQKKQQKVSKWDATYHIKLHLKFPNRSQTIPR
ncbi:hypothetical protein F0562_011903 [Nyssa sinensis]|uniref:Mechanosensitive ion channel MscS domain-containing protein n=1 Tax=Nyssa sinensis TaxID=561372 RepID=A0A5J4ZS61_9ASTE|nr:hypothetical protein F0562_011903 [Nyssa sinensis]